MDVELTSPAQLATVAGLSERRVCRVLGQHRSTQRTHRCSNDLQLVVSLLGIESRRASNEETRRALNDVMERVAVLARARTALHRDQPTSLEDALR